MSLRKILTKEQDELHKKCHSIEKFDKKLHTLLDDMAQTMYQANGVGLAAPQIGIMRRVAVIDVGEGIVEFINPEIIYFDGEQDSTEGCLSCPGVMGLVKRPAIVKTRAFDRDGNMFEIEGEGLFAVAMCHEFDHLDGVIFLDKAIELYNPEDFESGEE